MAVVRVDPGRHLFRGRSGFSTGVFRRHRADPEKEAPVGAIVAAVLGLLAFMLAFTFGMAATRFEARRQVVLDEANAIGTTYLRAGMLAEPEREIARGLLREYIDVRLQAVREEYVEGAMTRSAELHDALWKAAENAAAKAPSPVTALFIESLNEVIDLHASRVQVGVRSRIPGTIWAALFFVAVFSMVAMGYQMGLSGARRSLAAFALVLTFSSVLFLIADLDRPQEGFLRVSQQALIDQANSMKPAK
jgi:hypothetical protein